MSARDAVDPIAELLSQLSGVRRVAGSSSSQLQQLQMELQLQRQQQAQRQTLDRLARRPPASSASVSAATPAVSSSVTAVGQNRLGTATIGGEPVVQGDAARGAGGVAGSNIGCAGYLLSSLSPDDTDHNSIQDQEGRKQEVFLTELLLGALSLQPDQS